MATRVCAILGQLDRFRDSQAGQGMPRRELTGCAGDVDGDDIRRYKWRAGPGRCVPVRSAWLRSPAGPAVGLPRRNWAAVTNSGPSAHSPMARSIARAVRGVSGMVTTLPPLRVMTRVWWPRSSPRCSMSAPVAADTRSPLRGLYGTRVGDVAVVNSARSSASFSW